MQHSSSCNILLCSVIQDDYNYLIPLHNLVCTYCFIAWEWTTSLSLSSSPLHPFQGSNKDIQQLFNAIDHRIEALRLNAQHSSGESNVAEKEAKSRVSHESSPLDEEDKESTQEDTPSSPESTVESHIATFREKAVSLPSAEDDTSGCEEGEGEGERGKGEEEREGEGTGEGEAKVKPSEEPQEGSSTVTGTK